MATVHSYARFSSKKQEHGDSERRQKTGLEKFLASEKHTLSNLQGFDRGKSGFKGNKQIALNAFLEILRAKDGRIKPGDILYVEAIDRLSRKGVRPTQQVVNEILEAGVSIAISLPLEKVYRAEKTNELGDAIELAAFAFAAHVYSSLLSGRIKGFHAEAREVARKTKRPINSGATPAWMTRSKEGFHMKEGAKEAIAYIFARTIEGIGGKRLCKEMNERFPCFGYSGRWNEVYLRYILNSRQVLGEFQPNMMNDENQREITGEPIQGYFPVIIDEDTWLRANAASANRRVERGPTTEYVNLFTGIVWHAIDKCACHLYTYQQKRADGRKVIYRRLKSVKATDGVPGASTETVGIKDFEYVLLRWLKEIDLTVFEQGNSQASELASLVKTLERKQVRIEEIESDEEGSVKELTRQLTKLREECKSLSERIAKMKTDMANSTHASLDYIKRLNALPETNEVRQSLREAIKRVVKRITILPTKLGNLRRSPIGELVEIEFYNNARRTLVHVGKETPIVYNEDSVSTMPLTERKDLARLKSELTKALIGKRVGAFMVNEIAGGLPDR